MKILITGATGFIGSRLVYRLHVGTDYDLLACARRQVALPDGVHLCRIDDIDEQTNWLPVLSGIDVVIHLAGYAHVQPVATSEFLAEVRRINVAGTVHLAKQAMQSGVRRFIFLSSIKVHGEQTCSGSPFSASTTPAPEDIYGISKRDAEKGLRSLRQHDGMELVIIRPPLVYGPGVKGNFAAMIRILRTGIPLPLGSTHNKRSLVALDNLVDLLVTCIDHPVAGNQTFLVSDGEDLSTTELLRRLGRAMGKPARLLPVPVPVLQLGAALLGKKNVAQKLLGSLQVDMTATCATLGWQPPVAVDEGLRRCFPEPNQDRP
jgi:nucleoside-diphosphate-sugar epimerase